MNDTATPWWRSWGAIVLWASLVVFAIAGAYKLGTSSSRPVDVAATPTTAPPLPTTTTTTTTTTVYVPPTTIYVPPTTVYVPPPTAPSTTSFFGGIAATQGPEFREQRVLFNNAWVDMSATGRATICEGVHVKGEEAIANQIVQEFAGRGITFDPHVVAGELVISCN